MEHSSRYLIGIDLGTTNSVVAYIDTQEPRPDAAATVFDVPQITGFGEVRSLPALPSFLYFPTEDELQSALLSLPWGEHPHAVAGAIARDHGSLVPTRQVMSAKSWLSHGGVDREANILPREAQPPMISPVDASSRYLEHLREAWNHVFAEGTAAETGRMEKQDIVLTVPASFDEEARELTVQAAQRAGIREFILLEEPLAAFYSWTSAHHQSLLNELKDGELVLICDIGGGTSDFSLVRARVSGTDVQFERTAIGEHLLLGGDNLDLALARTVEQRLKATRLSLRQRHALQRACCAAKERLLNDPTLESAPITVLGSGRTVVGQTLTAELHRDDVLNLLSDGFLPITATHDMPKRQRTTGLRELGLPYASDPGITKHLAAFLRQAAVAMGSTGKMLGMARPDAVLFNGGFCEPAIVRDRIVEAIAHWFPDAGVKWRPKVLRNAHMSSAVAVGAAHYGLVRRGLGARIRAGSARSYYIGLRSEAGLQAVCVLPEGVEEGTTLPPASSEFAALANRPVSFTLLSSRTRHDIHGDIVTLDEDEVHRHAPLATLLRYGKKMREQELSVRLRASYTEMGTLELWCESTQSPHRWRLQFELRGVENRTVNDSGIVQPSITSPVAASILPQETLQAAERVIRSVFSFPSRSTGSDTPETVPGKLEAILGLKRDSWSTAAVRAFADVLLESAEGRKQSPQHEARWLNLVGFCLRPGFGFPGDERRVGAIRSLLSNGPIFARDVQCEVQWLVLLRRVAGGINASGQHELYRKLLPSLSVATKKRSGRANPQVEYESWRLVVSLEQLPADLRVRLGDELVARIAEDSKWLWPLSRVGARIPLYGPLMCVVAPDRASDWLERVLDHALSPERMNTVVELARSTGDRSRDVNQEVRIRAVRALRAAGADQDSIECLQKFVPPERVDAARMFGESLPNDLALVSSATCLLSLTALNPEPGRAA